MSVPSRLAVLRGRWNARIMPFIQIVREPGDRYAIVVDGVIVAERLRSVEALRRVELAREELRRSFDHAYATLAEVNGEVKSSSASRPR